jgi:hypothetical protein
MGLEGSARDERITQLLEGVFPGGEEVEGAADQIDHGHLAGFYLFRKRN